MNQTREKVTFADVFKLLSENRLAPWVAQERLKYMNRLGRHYQFYILNSALDLGEDWKASASAIQELQAKGVIIDGEALSELRERYQAFCQCVNHISGSNSKAPLSSERLQLARQRCKTFITEAAPLFKLEVNDWGKAQSALRASDEAFRR